MSQSPPLLCCRTQAFRMSRPLELADAPFLGTASFLVEEFLRIKAWANEFVQQTEPLASHKLHFHLTWEASRWFQSREVVRGHCVMTATIMSAQCRSVSSHVRSVCYSRLVGLHWPYLETSQHVRITPQGSAGQVQPALFGESRRDPTLPLAVTTRRLA